jgi:hypothetical protein
VRVFTEPVRTYHGTVSDLQGLQDMQERFCSMRGEEVRATLGGMVYLVGTEYGREGRCEVGQDAGQADYVGLLWHIVHAKCLLDGIL